MGYGAQVLVVDDDSGIRTAITGILIEEGYSAAESKNGVEAVDYLHASPQLPKLILLDLMMPELDGWGVIDHLRGDPALAQVPVVVMSAYLGHLTESQRAGLTPRESTARRPALLSKPIKLDELLDHVRKACGVKEEAART